jgi:hypothetical protein
MSTHTEPSSRRRDQRLADLKNRTMELERKLSDARLSFERELAQFSGWDDADDPTLVADGGAPGHEGREHAAAASPPWPTTRRRARDPGRAHAPDWPPSAADRTESLLTRGRTSAYRRGLPFGAKALIAALLAVVLAAAGVTMLFRHRASWPASVATVKNEVAQACQNPDVKSEPGQVNFACAQSTRQILWVFALMTSGNNPAFADAKTGRVGLEPISPGQGGEVAWSLNLHHPYDPANAVDSIAVAARAINNIIGGATLTGSRGNPVVQSGLESSRANCLRYTGSAALTSRAGFPKVCARPVTSPDGQSALVADVYLRWVAGATPGAAQDAAVLFANANNPGDPQVQAILQHLPNSPR